MVTSVTLSAPSLESRTRCLLSMGPVISTTESTAFTRTPSTSTEAFDGTITSLTFRGLGAAAAADAAAGISAVRTLSDHRATAFGDAYGTTIVSGPLTRFLARAVFVVDKSGTIRHAEYVPDITQHPNYDAALSAAKSAS